jgi:hypothetical protein
MFSMFSAHFRQIYTLAKTLRKIDEILRKSIHFLQSFRFRERSKKCVRPNPNRS